MEVAKALEDSLYLPLIFSIHQKGAAGQTDRTLPCHTSCFLDWALHHESPDLGLGLWGWC